MLLSIEEVASQLGVSKTAIYNKLKLKGYKELVIKKQGKSMIDEDLFKLIKDNIKFSNKSENQYNNNELNQEIAIDTDDILKMNQELISILKEQLKEKDNQLREKDKQIEELHRLVENNQVLLKQQQDKETEQLKTEQLKLEEHFQEIDEKLIDLKDKLIHKDEPKKGFFGFKRK